VTGLFFVRKEEMIINNNIYIIGGLSIKLVACQTGVIDYPASHLSDNPPLEIDLEILTKTSTRIEKPEGNLLIDNAAKWVCIPGEYYNTSIYISNQYTGEVLCRADANQDWSKAEVTYLDNQMAKLGVAGFLYEILFRNRILFKRGLVLHASAISWEGQGLAFTAPSGTGKSTQARLWAKHMGALILNDDRPALRIIKNITYVYGTPWSGKKKLYHNASAPLTALVLLEQAAENQIIRLQVPTAVSKIMPRCFLPYYDQEIMAMCLNNLGEMLARTPVYLLKCRPDKESVELLHQCLQHQGIG
jgi:hypothetical protein